MQKTCSFTLLLGRICLGAIFIMAGIGKFLDYDSEAQYMASKGMTMIPFFLYSAAIVEIVGGLSILLGIFSRIGATVLILYLIPVTIIFHGFWSAGGPERQQLQIEFLKNLAIIGGLLYVVGAGSGKFSIASCSCCHEKGCN